MIEIKAYQCSFCGYYKKTKQSVLRHEVTCYHDPENRACASCNENIFSEEYYETEKECTNNYCNKREVFLIKRELRYGCPIWEPKNKDKSNDN